MAKLVYDGFEAPWSGAVGGHMSDYDAIMLKKMMRAEARAICDDREGGCGVFLLRCLFAVWIAWWIGAYCIRPTMDRVKALEEKAGLTAKESP